MKPDLQSDATTDEGLIARGFWGPRQESPDAIADKLVAFLVALDDVFGETLAWSSQNLPGKSLTEPTNARQVIADAFRKNTDAPHLGINQAYDAHSKRFKQISISMSVGGYSNSPRLRNAFIVTWHAMVLAEPILRQVIAMWDPDWGDITSRTLLRTLAETRPVGSRIPSVGYLTYLSEGRARALPGNLDKLSNGGIILGTEENGGFVPTENITEYAKEFKHSEAFSPMPTSRSKL